GASGCRVRRGDSAGIWFAGRRVSAVRFDFARHGQRRAYAVIVSGHESAERNAANRDEQLGREALRCPGDADGSGGKQRGKRDLYDHWRRQSMRVEIGARRPTRAGATARADDSAGARERIVAGGSSSGIIAREKNAEVIDRFAVMSETDRFAVSRRGESKQMATATTSSIQTYLGAKADSLLGFKSPKISKDHLHLPGP